MKKKVSLKDIAKIVDVSIPLVSYVLNNKGKENRISVATAKRIREVAKELNYQPNLNARSLKTNKTRTIGVILADISNPFFANLARTIEDESYLSDYTVIFGSSDEKVEKFERVLSFMKTRQVDGFILAAPEGSKELVLGLKQSEIPFVLIDRYFKDFDSNHIIINNKEASILATDYLLGRGNKKIASVMYDSQLAHYQDRRDGYLQAMVQSKNSEKYIVKINNRSIENDMRTAILKLILEDDVDAIYFNTNALAEEGLKHLMNICKNILKKIDVVMFDQNKAYFFLEDFIPYLNQPIRKMGQEAVRLIINEIETAKKLTNQIYLNAKLEVKR